jgi:hypothetical protein
VLKKDCGKAVCAHVPEIDRIGPRLGREDRQPETAESQWGAIRIGSQLGTKQLSNSTRGSVKSDRAEAMGIGSASSILSECHSRIPFPDLRTESTPSPRWPSRRDTASHPRYRYRARKLSADQESTIRALAATRSLRALAAEFGVSHETIRAVLRPAPAA